MASQSNKSCLIWMPSSIASQVSKHFSCVENMTRTTEGVCSFFHDNSKTLFSSVSIAAEKVPMHRQRS